MLQKYCFDPQELAAHLERIVENLNPYLESNVTNSIFVYMITGIRLEKSYLANAVKKLPEDMSTKVMTIYDQLILEGREQGIETTVQKMVLNAFDAGIDIATIRIITGESEKKIKQILVQNKRIS